MKSKTKTALPREAGAVLDALRGASRLLITSHVNPDGDAVGSVLALATLARSLGVQSVTCCMQDPVPRVYEWLAESGYIEPPGRLHGPFDTVLIADANSISRTGLAASLVTQESRLVVVDHHIVEQPDWHVGFVDPSYAATGEMVAELFEAAGVPLTHEVAECLYVAISTDTGSFRYANTTARSHRIAARLIETGINIRDITSKVIDLMSLGKFQLLRILLDRAELSKDGSIAHAAILDKDLSTAGALSEDVDGLINYLRNLEGVQLAILFREAGATSTKVSFRSQPEINSSEIARHFGGGGHAMAAGATLPWPLDEAKSMLFHYLRHTLRMQP